MKNKLLVIFLFALISIIIIYSKTNKKDYTLYIGNYDNYIDIEDKINNKYNNLNKYLFEKITYKELINAIKNNDYIVIKDKKIYLQQLINNASYAYEYNVFSE